MRNNNQWLAIFFQDPLSRTAAPPIIEKAKKQNKQQAPTTADLFKQVVSSLGAFQIKSVLTWLCNYILTQPSGGLLSILLEYCVQQLWLSFLQENIVTEFLESKNTDPAVKAAKDIKGPRYL